MKKINKHGRLTTLSAASSPCVLILALGVITPHAWAEELPIGAGETLSLKGADIVGKESPAPTVTEKGDSYTIESSNTATKLDLSPRQTPQTIVTVTNQQLKDFHLTDINSTLDAAGVNVQRVETDRTYFSVRGFDVSNFQLDGIGLPFSSEEQMGDIDTILYDHIDVLKGANGLLSTPGNPAATVNFVRKRPTREFQASASFGYGSWDKRRSEFDLSGALNEAGTVRGRFIAMDEVGDSYLDRYSKTKNVFSGILEFDLNDSNTLTVGHSQQRNRPNGIMWGGVNLYNSDGSKHHFSQHYNTGPDWTYWDTNDKQTFVELASDLGYGWQSKATLNYNETSGDGEMFIAQGLPDTGETSFASKFKRGERQILGDFYVKGPFELFSRTHEVVLGTSWAKDDVQWTSQDAAAGVLLPPNFGGRFPHPEFGKVTSSADFTNFRRSYYAATTLNLTDGLKFIGGANWTKLTSSGEQTGDAHAYSKSKVTPYYGLVYDFHPNYSAYVSYTEIFNPQFKNSVDGGLLDPVEGDSVEGGIKGEWFDKRLNASISLFRTKQDNYGEYADQVGTVNRYKGIDIKSEGYELTVGGELSPGWQMNAGMTHLFSLRNKDGSAARTYIPQNQVYLSTSYKVPQIQGLKVGASMNWQSEIFRDQGKTASGQEIVSKQDSYAVFNTMASYDIDQNWNVALNVNNIFNEKYLTSLYWAQSFYAAPRNTMATVTWKY
ncbi:TonB-dependent siderophore receptor [Ectopseudomonas mendocina]|uniref:TonB-dependent siderophore receptor n=1 Tax=Ectopseudomonas mendocina TaxID=300 RepID=A0ABZ2RGC8_ECTME